MNAPQKEIHPFADTIHSFCIFADMKRIMTYILLIAVITGCSPKWEPGGQRDRAVPVTYTFPVIFQLR
jgi:hypothetical protein